MHGVLGSASGSVSQRLSFGYGCRQPKGLRLYAMLLMPNGGSIFLKVLNTAGMCKDAKWVVEQHVELAMEVTSGNPERLVGVIMDNTKTNLSALKQLQERWLCLGCFAHGLALLIKDLAGLNEKHTYFMCVYIIYLYRHIVYTK